VVAESLAELVRTFRSGARLSQEALAERAGLSTRTVSDIETGFAKTPRLMTVMLLAEALGAGDADRMRLQNAARRPGVHAAGAAVGSAAPLRPITLIGRETDVARVGALVCSGDVQLVTLCGPAGVGKTSLAVRVAFENTLAFAHGAVLVELATIADPALVPSAIAQALGVRESADSRARESVIQSLATREMLLVLDNLEQLTPIAGWIGDLLETCNRVTVLATSREALHLRAEHVYAVKPLETAAAAELFVRRAQSVQPGFTLTSANDAAVTTIVARLEGLPLAIELAAPRIRLLPAKALAARLDRRLPFLAEGAVDLPRRQQTMRGAIAWSYDLLEPDEQYLFRALAALYGGGSIEAARAVAGADESQSRPFLLRLAALVDKSLLSLEEDADGEPRVSMLEMLREYAYEQLSASDELDAARSRHAAYFAGFARTAEPELGGSQQVLWVNRLEREHPNMRAALQWALDRGETTFGLELAGSVWRLWWLRGYLTEGQEWLRKFLDLVPSATPPVHKGLHAKVLRALVVLMSGFGNFNDALGPCEEAIRLHREAGDDSGLGGSLTSLGIIMQFRGDFARAMELHEESLAIRRRLGDELGMAVAHSNLASVAFTKGDLIAAARFAEESATIYRRIGHTSGMSHALMKLGLVAMLEGHYERAERLFEETLRLQKSLGSSGNMFYSLTNLGGVAHKQGHLDVALARYHEALDLLRAVPNKPAIAATLEGLAAAIASAGDPRRAARIFSAADALRRTIGAPRFPTERADYEASVEATRVALGAGVFETEWQIGASMTLERTLEEARAAHPTAVR
jgi:predicted ATPase/transcriptional regulator with XRE-family HTH domain